MLAMKNAVVFTVACALVSTVFAAPAESDVILQDLVNRAHQLQQDAISAKAQWWKNLVKAGGSLLSRYKVASVQDGDEKAAAQFHVCLLYTSPSPRDATLSRMPSSA